MSSLPLNIVRNAGSVRYYARELVHNTPAIGYDHFYHKLVGLRLGTRESEDPLRKGQEYLQASHDKGSGLFLPQLTLFSTAHPNWLSHLILHKDLIADAALDSIYSPEGSPHIVDKFERNQLRNVKEGRAWSLGLGMNTELLVDIEEKTNMRMLVKTNVAPTVPPKLERSLSKPELDRLKALLYNPMAHPIHLMLRWNSLTPRDVLEERNDYLRDAGFDIDDNTISDELPESEEAEIPYLENWSEGAELRAAMRDGRYLQFIEYRQTGVWPEKWLRTPPPNTTQGTNFVIETISSDIDIDPAAVSMDKPSTSDRRF